MTDDRTQFVLTQRRERPLSYTSHAQVEYTVALNFFSGGCCRKKAFFGDNRPCLGNWFLKFFPTFVLCWCETTFSIIIHLILDYSWSQKARLFQQSLCKNFGPWIRPMFLCFPLVLCFLLPFFKFNERRTAVSFAKTLF